MSEQKVVVNSGGSVLGLLGVVFVTLKLLGIAPVAAWSWWWVTAPFWAGIAIFAVFLMIGLLVLLVAAAVAAYVK